MLKTLKINDRNIWSHVLLHLVLCFLVDVHLLPLEVGAVLGELLMSPV